MERRLAFAGSHSRPMCLNHYCPAKTRSLTPISSSTATFSSCRSSTRKSSSMIVRATNSFHLSSNWDVSGFSASTAAPLPKLEDLDTSSMLIRQRIIFLGTQVDDFSADLVIGQLLFLDAEESTKDIKLFINSPGGSVTAGMGIYDVMKMIQADISTVCMGVAASVSAFILSTGTKGKRFCMPNARIMIHQLHALVGGTGTEAAIRAREMNYHRLKLQKILVKITGKPEKQIEDDTFLAYFMSSWEAKEYGLIDEVINDGKPGLVAPFAEAAPPPEPQFVGPWKAEGDWRRRKLPSEHSLLKGMIEGGETQKSIEQ